MDGNQWRTLTDVITSLFIGKKSEEQVQIQDTRVYPSPPSDKTEFIQLIESVVEKMAKKKQQQALDNGMVTPMDVQYTFQYCVRQARWELTQNDQMFMAANLQELAGEHRVR
jgi:hypothetical protein